MLAFLMGKLGEIGFSNNMSMLLASSLMVFLIVFLSVIAKTIARRYVLKFIDFVVEKTHSQWGKSLIEHHVFKRLSHIAPAVVICALVPILHIDKWPESLAIVSVTEKLAFIYIIFVVMSSLSAVLNSVNDVYITKPISRTRPIKSYLQVVNIALIAVTLLTSILILTGENPTMIFTGLGAMTAILALTFKDTILSFVASIQLSAYDIVRVGDWIEVGKYGANGDVIDMSLNTIKVQNFDKTIVTVPTYALMTEGVINWRGMERSGGRRIKRSINIDMQSVRFCEGKELERLSRIYHLQSHIKAKAEEIMVHNEQYKLLTDNSVNGRKLTNIGLFRAYLQNYLKSHPKVHSEHFTFLIRQLQPGATGLPLQIYVFTNDTNWVAYEAIQADIFDHILAVLPEFGLRVFQNISDHSYAIAVSKDLTTV